MVRSLRVRSLATHPARTPRSLAVAAYSSGNGIAHAEHAALLGRSLPLRSHAVLATVGFGGCPPPPPDVPLRAIPSPRPERRQRRLSPPPGHPLRDLPLRTEPVSSERTSIGSGRASSTQRHFARISNRIVELPIARGARAEGAGWSARSAPFRARRKSLPHFVQSPSGGRLLGAQGSEAAYSGMTGSGG
jgi:hypothetical protein